MKNEQDGSKRAGEAVHETNAGEPANMIAEEPYTGEAKDGESCTMTDGRSGTIVRTATGRVCRADD